jgi:acyl-CoA reductase-like NAD-dependent aldehyde dehydrogenase
MLHRMAQGIREQAEALAHLQRLDNGKPIKECAREVKQCEGLRNAYSACKRGIWEACHSTPIISVDALPKVLAERLFPWRQGPQPVANA